MTELNEALARISEIRLQLARSEVFRGYRSATTACSGVLALIASAVQAWWLPQTMQAFLDLWVAVALFSIAMLGTELIFRSRRSQSSLQREMTTTAIEQFVPCLVAGGLLTYVLANMAPGSLWLLPGLWAILFGLGVFASRRVMPRGTAGIGAWYLLSGLICIIRSPHPGAMPPPWEMAVCFGIGQFLAAFVLYWNLERRHGE